VRFASLCLSLAPSGNVSNSFSAALIHETGRVFRVIGRPRIHTPHVVHVVIYDNIVKKARRPDVILSG